MVKMFAQCKSHWYFHLNSLESRCDMLNKDNMDLLKLLLTTGVDTTVGEPSRDNSCAKKRDSYSKLT